MSFLGPKMDTPTARDPERQENRFSGALPVPFGAQRLAFKHIEQPWNYRTYTVYKDKPGADEYSMAGWLCPGPIYGITAIVSNGNFLWLGDGIINPMDGSYYMDVEVPYWTGRANPICFRIYWGYEDQPACPLLTGTAETWQYDVWEQVGGQATPPLDDMLRGAQSPSPSHNRHGKGSIQLDPAPNIHPPYAGKAYIVFYSIDTGVPGLMDPDTGANIGGGPETTGPRIPELEAFVLRKPRDTDFDKFPDWPWGGVSPVAANFEALTDPRWGLGLPDSVVPKADWLAACERVHLYKWAGLNRSSPVFVTRTDAATKISEINGVFGGLLVARDGKIYQDVMPETGDSHLYVWLQNWQFEDLATESGQTLKDWWDQGTSGVSQDTTEKISGSASMLIEHDGNTPVNGAIQANPTIDPARSYKAYVWCKTDTPGSLLSIGDGADWYMQTIEPGTDWGWHEVDWDGTDASLTLHTHPSNAVGSKIWIDDVGMRMEISEITEDDLVSPPKDWSPGDSEDQITEVRIKYKDIAERLEDNAITVRSSMARILRGEANRKEISADLLRDKIQADLLGKRVMAPQRAGGTLDVLRTRAVNPDGSRLLAGDIIRLNYAPYGLNLVCRIHEMTDEKGESVKLKVMAENNLHPEAYTPAADTVTQPPDPAATDLVYYAAILLPPKLSGRDYPREMTVLYQREDGSTLFAEVWMSLESDAGSRWSGEEALLDRFRPAVHGSLVSSIDDTQDDVIIDLDSSDYDDLLDEGFSPGETEEDRMLLIIGDEWISLGELVDNTGSQWEFDSCKRGALETTAASHSATDPVWLIQRSKIQPAVPKVFSTPPATLHFKAIPVSIAKHGDPTADFSLTLPDPTLDAPTGFAVNFDSKRYRMTVTWNDPSGEYLDHILLRRKIDAGDWKDLAIVPPGAEEFSEIVTVPEGGLSYSRYWYAARAVSGLTDDGRFDDTDGDSGYADAVPPSAPSGISGSGGTGQATASWTHDPDFASVWIGLYESGDVLLASKTVPSYLGQADVPFALGRSGLYFKIAFVVHTGNTSVIGEKGSHAGTFTVTPAA